MTPSRHCPSRRVRKTIWILYWIVLFALTHTPVMGGVKLPDNSDKVIHFVMFFLLTLLGGWTYRTTPTGTIRGLLLWTIAYIAYAGLDEWLQQFVGRITSLNDFWANLGGVLVATCAVVAFLRPRAISDPAPAA